MAQLNRFTSEEWDAWARKSNWNSRLLAKLTGIPARTLNRYTHDTFGQSPQHWLDLNRLGLAPALLKQIRCVKTVAYELAYPSHASFTQGSKRSTGLRR
jgi:AraC-like DNA-binding protein